MGADESKPNKTNYPQQQQSCSQSQAQPQSSVSKEEVRILLEQQRREYERKLRELQTLTAKATATTSHTQNTNKNNSHQQNVQKDQANTHVVLDTTRSPANQLYPNLHHQGLNANRNDLVRRLQINIHPICTGSGYQQRASPSTSAAAAPNPQIQPGSNKPNVPSGQRPLNSSPQIQPSACSNKPNVQFGQHTPTTSADMSFGAHPSTSSTGSGYQQRASPSTSAAAAPNPQIQPGSNKPNVPSGQRPLNSSPQIQPSACSNKPNVQFGQHTPTTSANMSFGAHPSTSRPAPSAPPMPTSETKTTCPQNRKPKSKQNKSDDDKMNCITCGNKYGLTIFQCSIGHSSCRDCKMQSKPCGICRNPISNVRNIAMEAYISEVQLEVCLKKAETLEKCPNHRSGCTLCLKMADIEIHERECPFREYSCPIQMLFGRGCDWKGKQSKMGEHFKDVHPEHCQAIVDTEMYLINVFDSNHMVYFIDMAPYNFLVHLKVDATESQIYMTVQHFGTQMSSAKWTYEWHVFNKRVPRKKFTYTDVCLSNVVPIQEIFSESKCAVIPLNYAMTYVNEGCLTYKFFIKRQCDEGPSNSRGGRSASRGRGWSRNRGARSNSRPREFEMI